MIQVNVKALRGALAAIGTVVEKKATVPILTHVLIRTTPGQMMLTATDLDLMVEQTIALEDAGANSADAFCVAADLIKSIAGKLPADGIATIDRDDKNAIGIRCGRARFKLPTLPCVEFRGSARADWVAPWVQPGSGLTAMIDSVRFAISTEETRYYLNGIYWHVPDGSACQFAAATDGSRLARYHGDVPDGAEGMPGIIVPRKAVAAIDTLIDAEGGGMIEVAVSRAKFRFAIGQCVLTGKTIDGTFPDYTRVIPAANSMAAWFDPAALAEAVERVLTISSEKTRLIAMDFTSEMVTLRVVSPENGTASEDVPCEYDGTPLTIGFNGRFLLDVLAHLKGTDAEGTKARVLLADAAAPSLWQQSDDAARLYVLMPMRV